MQQVPLTQSRSPRHSTKQTAQNMSTILSALLNNISQIPRGSCPMQQLSLQYKKDNFTDIEQLRFILRQLLSYPSTEIAELHMKANRLGELDLREGEGEGEGLGHAEAETGIERFKESIKECQACPCCGFVQQKQQLRVCTDIASIRHMGVSTQLYFDTIKNVTGLLIVMFFVFTLYAVISNIVASNLYKKDITDSVTDPALLSYEGFLVISLGSKQLHSTESDKVSYTIQCWLGVVMIIIWSVIFVFIKKQQRTKTKLIDKSTVTASDFTILIKNFPKGMTLEQLQSQLRQFYSQRNGDIYSASYNKQVRVIKINEAIPFYLDSSYFSDQRIEQLNKKYETYQQTFISWIEQRMQAPEFSTPEKQRMKIKAEYLELKEERKKIFMEISQNIKKQMKIKENYETVPAFVTFSNSYMEDFFVSTHENSDSIFNYLPCVSIEGKYFYFKDKGNEKLYMAKIRKAPEPEDIIWTNLGQNKILRIKKKLLTFTITLLVLGISFGSVYGLSKAQTDYSKTHSDTTNQYISVLISLCISIINIIIQQILRYLTKIQRSQTRTDLQTSLGMKAVFALLINSIVIPILVNYFFKENLYGVNGLAYDIFYLGITSSLLSPILKIFDGYYIFTRILKWYKTKPQKKLPLNQNQLNATAEYMQFQIGYEYIYVINLFLFTCFFCSLQPIITLFAIMGLILMFWSQKFSLFNRCQRPVPGNNSINTVMYQLIYLGPALYTIGSFCWSHFFKQEFIGIAPNLVAAIISGIILIVPYKKIVKYLFSYAQQPQRLYEQNRIFLPSQYDRLNPSTSKQAITEFLNFLAEKKKELQQGSKGQLVEFERKMIDLYGVGNRRNLLQMGVPGTGLFGINRGGNYADSNVIMQQIFGTGNNMSNPFLLANTVLLNNNAGFNMAAQNWMTAQQVTYQSGNKGNNGNIGGIFDINKFIGANNNDNRIQQQGQTITYLNQQHKNSLQPIGIDLGLNIVHSITNNLHHPQHSNTNTNTRKPHKGNLQPLHPNVNRNSRPNANRNSNTINQTIPSNLPISLFGNLLTIAQENSYGEDVQYMGSEGQLNKNSNMGNYGNNNNNNNNNVNSMNNNLNNAAYQNLHSMLNPVSTPNNPNSNYQYFNPNNNNNNINPNMNPNMNMNMNMNPNMNMNGQQNLPFINPFMGLGLGAGMGNMGNNR